MKISRAKPDMAAIWQGIIMTQWHHQKWILKFTHFITSVRWYHQGNSLQQLLYHDDIAPGVNLLAIFDTLPLWRQLSWSRHTWCKHSFKQLRFQLHMGIYKHIEACFSLRIRNLQNGVVSNLPTQSKNLMDDPYWKFETNCWITAWR